MIINKRLERGFPLTWCLSPIELIKIAFSQFFVNRQGIIMQIMFLRYNCDSKAAYKKDKKKPGSIC